MNQTSKPPAYDFLRIRIHATLLTDSPLHCGDGGSLEAADWRTDKSPGADAGRINSVFSDHQGRACIPAPTLRGSLRARGDDPLLFGRANGDQGSSGKLRVYDARLQQSPPPAGDLLQDADSGTSLLTGVSLDPVTGTAADNRLFTHQVVPPGSEFALTLEADRVSHDELAQILTLLAGWDGSAASAIGRGRNHGWGRLRLLPDSCRLEVLGDAALADWMKAANDQPLPWRPLPLPEHAAPAASSDTLAFTLQPRSPLLVNQPGRVNDNGEHQPDLEFHRDADGNALLPGSSLRGALRARAQRILASIAHQRHDIEAGRAWATVDASIAALFGTERRASLLWFSDAVAAVTREHRQTFVAVDRFTNGVQDGALYQVRAADCDQLSGECGLAPRDPPADDWWKGLLLLLARDLLEGELNLGWGRSRGFGQCDATLLWRGQTLGDFSSLLAQCPEGEPEQWLQALERHVAGLSRDTHGEVAA